MTTLVANQETIVELEFDFGKKNYVDQKKIVVSNDGPLTEGQAIPKKIGTITLAAGLILNYYNTSLHREINTQSMLNEANIINKIVNSQKSTETTVDFSFNQIKYHNLDTNNRVFNLSKSEQLLLTQTVTSTNKQVVVNPLSSGTTENKTNTLNLFNYSQGKTLETVDKAEYYILNSNQSIPISLSHDGVQCKEVTAAYSASIKKSSHNILQKPFQKVGDSMKNFAAGFPLVEFQEIKKSWNNFIDAPTIKLFFTVIGSVLTLLLGTFSVLHWALLVMTTVHFLMRHIANKYQENDSYVTFYRNVQLFLWPYLLLVVINTLSKFVSFDGLPDGTFFALGTCWLIWGELKGIIENAETANLPVPPLLKKMVSNDTNDQSPPF
ncbi:phage holin family protein [Bacillus cereus]|uniref:phage holin family protein n=1 Tax=Bacillus cereus TaxID=1396 RepID=UPI002452BF26|nr:phage holin family protein [Bacillus cereus]MDH4419972.1 phage holin family protein [Bacillus cereus]